MNARFNTIARKYLFVLTASVLITEVGCKKEKKKNEVKFNSIAANGAQEVPSNTSTATATTDATYDKDTKIITYTLTFSGLNPVNGHFHKGASGTANPMAAIDLKSASGTFTSPITNSTTRALTVDEENDLLSGSRYYNLHTNDHPTGAIRGQMVAN